MDIHAHLKHFLATPLGEASFAVCTKLSNAGHKTYIAGGAVRDFLLDREVVDIDIATSALPQQVRELFALDVQYSEQVGSVVIPYNQFEFEVTTFRKESNESINRKPTTIEFTTLEEDVHRRDFTINALYADSISGEVLDLVGGLNDLNERIVASIGEPQNRFKQDPLRVLRAVRLRAGINGQYSPAVYAAMQGAQKLLQTLTPVTVWKELEKLLLGPNPHIGLEDLWELGIMEIFWPELSALKGIAQPYAYHKEGDVWNHTLQICSAFTKEHAIDVRLAGLLHDAGKATTFSIDQERIHFNNHASVSKKITRNIGSKFSLPKRRIEKLSFLVAHHMMIGDLLTMTPERKAHWYYHEWFAELLQLFYLDIAGTTPADFSLYEKVVADYNAYLNKQPKKPKELLTGKQIMNILHIQPSALIQCIKQDLQTLQFKNKITTKKEAINYLIDHKDDYTTTNMRQ